MTWYKQVTDPQAVHAAMAEFDELHRDEFLRKYGFRRVKRYFIFHDKKFYDCKPVFLAAFRIQTGNQLDGQNAASGGTAKHIRPRLEKMGFRVIDTDVVSHSLESLERDLADRVDQASVESKKARRERLRTASKIPKQVTVTTTAFMRNPDVIAEVLERAGWRCEGCGNAAPFEKARDGHPYLEVHHRKRLADGGEDTVENAIALCPNCHRERHYGKRYSCE